MGRNPFPEATKSSNAFSAAASISFQFANTIKASYFANVCGFKSARSSVYVKLTPLGPSAAINDGMRSMGLWCPLSPRNNTSIRFPVCANRDVVRDKRINNLKNFMVVIFGYRLAVGG